jgi:hypothetical protein
MGDCSLEVPNSCDVFTDLGLERGFNLDCTELKNFFYEMEDQCWIQNVDGPQGRAACILLDDTGREMAWLRYEVAIRP